MNCRNKGSTMIAASGLAALLIPSLVFAQLGSATMFAVLGGSTVTNTGPSTIVGSVGVSPGISITGLPLGQPMGGTIHEGDAVAAQAQSDLTIAYNSLAAMACDSTLTGQDLGGMTLAPGVYCFDTSAQLTGTLTLDGQSDPNAVFVVQIGSTLTTGTSATVSLIGGASPGNVYWQVGSSAIIGTGTVFMGNIVALESITLVSGASLTGRALARTGAVTMDTNAIVGGTSTAVREVTWGMVKALYME